MGQDRPRTGAAGRRRRRDPWPLRGGVRAPDRNRVRPVSGRPDGGVVRATVFIRPKSGILDPQGEAVRDSPEKLGFPVDGARVGRLVDLELATADPVEARLQVERMCADLLAN